jgi:hypothetical protein
MIARPVTSTASQTRVVDDVLGWGAPRPVPPDGLSERLLARIGPGVAAWLALREQRPDLAARPLLVTKTRLTRLVCDGLQREPAPFVHAWANVRGTVVHAAIEEDLRGARSEPAALLVERSWHRLATDRPGDPASIGTWLNARDGEERATLCDEAARLVDTFREVWPDLHGSGLRLLPEQRLVTQLGGRAVRLQGVPDVILESPVRDGHARTLLVDLKTGMPRGQQDRDELRFYALLATLRDEHPPFRWATLYVTEGRVEHEDLAEPVLAATADRVADALHQAVRIARTETVGDGEVLRGGVWCRGCRRADHCPVAAAG